MQKLVKNKMNLQKMVLRLAKPAKFLNMRLARISFTKSTFALQLSYIFTNVRTSENCKFLNNSNAKLQNFVKFGNSTVFADISVFCHPDELIHIYLTQKHFFVECSTI